MALHACFFTAGTRRLALIALDMSILASDAAGTDLGGTGTPLVGRGRDDRVRARCVGG